ncbi:MAG TPA: D-arabinono-1,4-lactone oxidase [Myxococcaceae bacterium]|nr:D-arabinono-1,4-lactone oxidase [Myxococcaceae bacterium]
MTTPRAGRRASDGPAETGVRPFVPKNFYWPKTVQEACACVEQACASNPHTRIRVRGSQHSEANAVYTTGFDPVRGPRPWQQGRVNLILDELLSFELGPEGLAVGAGHHLGPDPYAEGPAQQPVNSLAHKLDELGLALPALGGISHQSLGGFLSTGSAGGSVQHDLTDAISWVRLVDGSGRVRTINRQKHQDVFDAALPSFGLFGIIVEVGFDPALLPRKFDVAMTSQVVSLEKWGIDPFQEGELAKFFRENEYARLLWWPQPHVNKVEAWTGQRVPHDPDRKNPYVSFSPFVQQLAHDLFLHVLNDADLRRNRGGIRAVLRDLESRLEHLHWDAPRGRALHRVPHFRALRRGQWLSTIRPILRLIPNDLLVGGFLNLFLLDESHDDLQDIWYRALPHDNQIDDNVIPVVFTEMWTDLDRSHEVMRTLKRLFKAQGLDATGTMCVEIYAAKKRTAWMSPAHDVDVLRVDPFVFGAGKRTHAQARRFFRQHWEALSRFDFRNHWGKVLPPAAGPTGVAYRKKTFPRLADFLDLRRDFDPEGVFLNDYWREHLGF